MGAAHPAPAQNLTDHVRNSKRILNLGGLVIRASCIGYGQVRKYLSGGAQTTINNAAGALVLSQRRAGEDETYSFE